jgi:cytochrome c oxidase assembly protein subunit 15
VQFNHRVAAYILWLLAVLHLAAVAKAPRTRMHLNGALALAAAMTFQAALGITTLVHQTPIALALLHQAMALVVLTIVVVHAAGMIAPSASASAAVRVSA